MLLQEPDASKKGTPMRMHAAGLLGLVLLCATLVANTSASNFCKNAADLGAGGTQNCPFTSNEVLQNWQGYAAGWTWNNVSCGNFTAQNITDWQGTRKMWKDMADHKSNCCANDRRKMRCFDRCCSPRVPMCRHSVIHI